MTDPPPVARWRSEVRAFAELLALSGLAITQPLLDVFGRSPQHLIFRGVDRGDIVVWAVLVTFAVPIAAWIVGYVAGLVSPRLRTVLHSVALWGLASIALTLLLDTVLPRIPALATAAVVAALLVLLYHRTRGVRIWLSFLSPAPVVFLALFLLASPITPLLDRPGGSLGTVVRRPTRTVVLLLDELSLPTLLDADGDIDRDLFPNFARLADTSHWFRDTTTTSNLTARAAPSVLTGDPPVGGSAPVASFFPENLFTLLGGAMPITSSEVVTALCPSSVCERIDAVGGDYRSLLDDARWVLTNRLDPRDPEVDVMSRVVEERDAERRADVIDPEDLRATERHNPPDGGVERFDRFVESIGPEAGLHYIHLLLPHTPYRLLPDGTVYEAEEQQIGRFIDGWVGDPAWLDVGMQRYLLQLQWTDTLVGRVMDHLVEQGLWDDTNLLVTADHGFGFEPNALFRGLTEDVADDDTAIAQVLWVPFFVKTAGQTEGVVSDDPVRNLDLTPTVADLLDVDIPWEHEGRSAFDGGSGDPDEVGLYLGHATGGPRGAGEMRTLPRDRGRELMLGRTAADLAPPAEDVHGSDRIFRAGPRPDLWGEPVPRDLRRIDVDLEPFSRADDVDLDSGRLPVRFAAFADGVEPGSVVAVSVNGFVWSTVRITESEARPRIDAMLPPQAFQAGSNELAVHEIDPP